MNDGAGNSLALDDYRRYGRQMIIDGFGLPAQVKLQNAAVLVVGAGGLGCPALQYLCAAGVGRIGIVDFDVVETSNLQRQILHSEVTLGMPKVDSAAQSLRKLNSRTRIDTYNLALDPANAECLLAGYDVILDCTDNAPARYLLSDTAVRLACPLVSGAAQRLDGQLCTYNLPLGPSSASSCSSSLEAREQEYGPCYRCLFPRPPAPEMLGSCAETGILGAVTGVIGTLQALEAIKIITGTHDRKPSLLIYSALASPPFRSVTLRARRRACSACGDKRDLLSTISALDYVAFCGGPRPDWVQRGLVVDAPRKRIGAKELSEWLTKDKQSVYILDVRRPIEFGICHLPDSINIPLSELVASPLSHLPRFPASGRDGNEKSTLTVLVCRLGNDSQIAADALRECQASGKSDVDGKGELYGKKATPPKSRWLEEIVDLVGGLQSWAADVDPQFPVY